MPHSQRLGHSRAYGTPELRRMRAEHERYRLALGMIHQTTVKAARCSCCLAVGRVASDALLPTTRIDDWLRCEA